MSIYELLLIAHILGVAVWLGGSVVLLYLSRLTRAAGPEQALDFFNRADHAANHLMPPAAIIVLVAGIGMVIDASWSFSQLFVTAGLTMFLISLVFGVSFYGPEGKRIRALAAERGAAGPEVQSRIGRYVNLARIEVLLLTVVVVLMVVKPG